jgi:hypothetical protein
MDGDAKCLPIMLPAARCALRSAAACREDAD